MFEKKKKTSCNDILSLQDTFVIPEGGNLFHTQQSSSTQQQQQVDKYETGHRRGTVNKRQTLKLITFKRGLFKKLVAAGIKVLFVYLLYKKPWSDCVQMGAAWTPQRGVTGVSWNRQGIARCTWDGSFKVEAAKLLPNTFTIPDGLFVKGLPTLFELLY